MTTIIRAATRRQSLRFLAIIFFWSLLLPPSARALLFTNYPSAQTRPNIILIQADGLGYGDLGCYGQAKIKTPNLDALAKEGAHFTSFYVGSPDSTVARLAIFSGRHNTNDNTFTSLAELLQRAGYATCCVGVWDMPGTPPKRGFNEWGGLLTKFEANNPYPPYLWRFDPLQSFDGKLQLAGSNALSGSIAANDLFTAAATNVVRINKPEFYNKYRPFFLFLGYAQPRVASPDNLTPYDSEPWPLPEKAKAAAIERLDTDVGKILAALKHYNLETNTVVLFTSASGPRSLLGASPEFLHSTGEFRAGDGLQEGNLRVPLIISYLGVVAGCITNNSLCAANDILPTIADIAGISPPANIDGISFWPALTGRAQTNQHSSLSWELSKGKTTRKATRFGDWKAVQTASAKSIELYNLKTDPAETNNVAAKHPEILKQAKKLLGEE